jgi:hypothetical protein
MNVKYHEVVFTSIPGDIEMVAKTLEPEGTADYMIIIKAAHALKRAYNIDVNNGKWTSEVKRS